jgi:hypothetical protein
MMDLLKRFEEESRESQTDSLDGKDGPDLAKRLQGLDLGVCMAVVRLKSVKDPPQSRRPLIPYGRY